MLKAALETLDMKPQYNPSHSVSVLPLLYTLIEQLTDTLRYDGLHEYQAHSWE